MMRVVTNDVNDTSNSAPKNPRSCMPLLLWSAFRSRRFGAARRSPWAASGQRRRRAVGERRGVRVGDLRVGRVGRDARTVACRGLVRDVERAVVGAAGAEGDHGAGA